MTIRDVTRVSGSLQDVTRLSELPDDDCNVLLVSSRTLYLLANYAVSEVNFLGRYFTDEFAGGLVKVLEDSSPEVPFVREVAQNFRNEVIPVTCDLVAQLQDIAVAIRGLQFAGCCPPQGDNPPQPEAVEGDPPPAGYEEYDPTITDRKCKLANMAVDDLVQIIDILIANEADTIANFTIATMSALWALVVGLIAAGPLAWALAGLGAIASLIGFFLVNELNLVGLKALIENNRQDLVCALFEATSNTNAFTEFKNVLDLAGADPLDLLFLDTLNLLDGLTTLFFAPEGDEGAAIEARLDGYPVTTSCAGCAPPEQFWTIAPGTALNWDPSTPFMGTGTVLNDGTQFVINSVPRVAQPGFHVIALMLQAYVDNIPGDPNLLATPLEFHGGTITRVDGPTSGWTLRGRRQTSGQCGTLLTDQQPGINPGAMNDRALILYMRNAPFSLTFSVDTLPNQCP